MSGFYLTLESSATFSLDAPTIEILIDGLVVTSFLETETTGSGTSIRTVYIDYDTSIAPGTIQARINDASSEVGRTVTLDSVLINGRDIRDATLTDGQGQQTNFTFSNNLDLDTTNTDWLFGQSAPTLALFGTATYTGTTGDDFLNGSKIDLDVVNLGDGDDTANGNQGDDIIFGGNGNDLLVGAAGIDVLVGGSGNDELRGQLGDDILYGEDGDDRIYGNEGNDTLNGGAGNDILSGFADDDILYGEDGVDRISGGLGNDRIYGGNDKDFLYGEEGNDIIEGGAGDDIIEGGAGDDNISGGDGNDRVDGGAGIDVITTGAGLDRIFAGDGNDEVSGGDDNDRIEGGAGDDLLNGDGGQDNISGGTGNDNISGGTEADILHGNEGDDTLHGGDHNDTLYGGDGQDTLNGDAGADRIYGGADNDVINGGSGTDNLYGEDGDDTLDGGGSADSIYGGNGNDTIFGRSGDDYIEGGTGNDTIFSQGQNDFVRGGDGDDAINGGGGDDRIFGDEGIDDLRGGGGNDRIRGGTGDDIIRGGNGDDVLGGDEGDDRIFGQGGNDRIFGMAGNDFLNGGDGNDHLFGREGSDTLIGGNGDDTLVYDGVDTIDGGNDTDSLFVAGFDTVTIDFSSGLATNVEIINLANQNGIAAANNLQISMADIATHTDAGEITITGDVGIDQVNFTLTGTEVRGADINIDGVDYAQFTLGGTTANVQLGLVYNGSILTADSGGSSSNTPTSGDDILTGTPNDDTISGLEGNDVIVGDNGNDVLNGDEGNDILAGENGNDTLDGGDGNDTLNGGRGNDTLNGGDGDDILHASLSGSIEQGLAPSVVEANNTGVFYNSATGNFYQFVTASLTNTEAAAAAAAAVINGVSGHLATITTQGENDFIGNLTGANFAWIDGADSGTEDTFVWTQGPDAGTEFWSNGDTTGNYQNFYQGSADSSNSATNDNVIFLGEDFANEWFAFRDNYDTNYVIEWEGGAITQETIIGYDSRNETNYLNGGDGNDSLYGAMGDDVLIGGNGADVIEGGAGNDTLFASGFSEAEIQAILATNPDVQYSEETGNFYQFVTAGANYSGALAGATSTTLNGVTGHLATITSAEENEFITSLVGDNFVWVDGTDSGTEGTFTWTQGPDAGTEFWNGGGETGSYENWYLGSPTTNSDANDHVTFLGTRFGGQWYIFTDTRVQGYVVEFEASAFDTETSANSLSGGFGADRLYASTGEDTFIFEADSAFNDIDTIFNFDNSEDKLDLSDILDGITIDATNIEDYLSVDAVTGVRVDVNGTGTFGDNTQIASFQGAVGVDDAITMFNDGEIVL